MPFGRGFDASVWSSFENASGGCFGSRNDGSDFADVGARLDDFISYGL